MVARAIARDRNVKVTPGKLTGQCLELGPLDEVSIDQVPYCSAAVAWSPANSPYANGILRSTVV